MTKAFQGGLDTSLLTLLKHNFATVRHAKPEASRKESSETYVVAQGFKGAPERVRLDHASGKPRTQR